MQAPKKKTSKSKRGMRRAHDAIRAVSMSVCSSCGEAVLYHHVCSSCGNYRGRQVVKMKGSDVVSA